MTQMLSAVTSFTGWKQVKQVKQVFGGSAAYDVEGGMMALVGMDMQSGAERSARPWGDGDLEADSAYQPSWKRNSNARNRHMNSNERTMCLSMKYTVGWAS